MRPLEQYPTLRKGREIMYQEDAAAWQARMARIHYWWRRYAHWLALHLIKWGYKLERYATRKREVAW